MNNLNLLIVEGNTKEDTEIFIKAAGSSASENLKKLLLKLEPSAVIEIVHPGNETEVKSTLDKINNYNGIIFTGGAMRITDQTKEIKKHINFANECFNHSKKILAICWGLQVCVTAAGGAVYLGKKGAHLGIASNVEINATGKEHPIYKDKKNSFNTPAFNFDEVTKIPFNAKILASDEINNVMGLHFHVKSSEVWGLQICATAAGGTVSAGKNGAHLGIALNVEINQTGKEHSIYKDKKNFFNTPAFNFDEVSKIPSNAKILSSDEVNNVMGLHFHVKSSEIWGVQYHPDYYYDQTINLTNLRKQSLLDNNHFNNEGDFEDHIIYIKKEEKKIALEDRSREIINWLNYIKENN